MDERSSRIFFGLCMLVLVWIGVYWMWQPSRQQEPVITFEPNPAQLQKPVDPQSIEDPGSVDLPIEFTGESTDESASEPVANIDSELGHASSGQDASTLIAPEFTEHVVQADERMQAIAKMYFGSTDDWGIIAKANPRVDPMKLKVGMILRIPKDKTNIQGKLVGADAEPGVIKRHTQTESKVIEYIVQSGDSLSRISQRIYGSSRYTQFIFDNNRDILRSKHDISIGQLLKLPPIPDENDAANPDG